MTMSYKRHVSISPILTYEKQYQKDQIISKGQRRQGWKKRTIKVGMEQKREEIKRTGGVKVRDEGVSDRVV